jgi:hypothetical protein
VGSGPPPAYSSHPPGLSSQRISVDPPVTQPSTISVSTGAHSADQVRQRRTTAIAIASVVMCILAVIAGVTALMIYRRGNADTAAGDPAGLVTPGGTTTSTSAPPSTSAGTTSAPLVSNGIEIDQSDAGAVAMTNPTGAPATPPPPVVRNTGSSGGVRTPRTAQPTPPTPPAPPPSAKVADPCTPPYFYDAKGVKHYKEQCI